jgi:hypothetical protein
MGGMRIADKILVGNVKGSDYLGNEEVDDRIEFKLILEVGYEVVGWISLAWDGGSLL